MVNPETEKVVRSLTAGDTELSNIFDYYIAPQNTSGSEKVNIMSMLSELKARMQKDIAQFTFKKLNGEIREAYGTRASDIIASHGDTPTGNRKQSPSTFPYYDIEKRAWRCFKPELLISVNSNYTI